jgi:hypothetical protein
MATLDDVEYTPCSLEVAKRERKTASAIMILSGDVSMVVYLLG